MRLCADDRFVVQKADEVVAQVRRRLVPLRRLFLDGLGDDRLQVARDFPVQLAQAFRFLFSHLSDEPVAIVVVERGPEGQQLVKCQAKGIDVPAASFRPSNASGGM